MELKKAMGERRSFRALEPVQISEAMIEQLAWAASMAPSCFNKQPWRFVFVRSREMLEKVHGALSEGNEWARDASMLVVVASRKELDCIIRGRQYYQFDTGLAVSHLMLMATDMGLVAHAMAGFSPERTRKAIGIPEDMEVITILAVGKRSSTKTPNLSDEDWEMEDVRPGRLETREFAYMERYS
jgi:nitroreductase